MDGCCTIVRIQVLRCTLPQKLFFFATRPLPSGIQLDETQSVGASPVFTLNFISQGEREP